ncbi:hypothetical protein [Aliiroseovarius crassostreae]|uniref:hypothetical protein n=1 Tax=Aliiroseovarius crassostreae TaxID=154981 RepID=UPI0021FD3643|nr:hypothetical protein [Aliiroseovarius crassostreae]UWP88132.1 hypothetical protein K3J57_09375 [Aliiroseovarius crassostreae]UWQ00751.1 hypothetical protein K3X44_09440 [Aliiroseovarius crassostreae]
MFFKRCLVGCVLTVTAFLTPAYACEQHEKQAQSCLAGHEWNEDAKTCVPVVSS